MKRLVGLLFLTFIGVVSIEAQVQLFVQVRGKVYGVDEYEPVPYKLTGANVLSYCVGDSAATSKKGVTDERGMTEVMYTVPRLPDNPKFHVRISYVGMETLDTICTPVKGEFAALHTPLYKVNLDSIVLKSKPVTLEEAQVIAELQKMYERGDTIIFNAQAYEMPSGSTLLELVRRLPGLQYDGNELTYNGRRIEEIKLNGDKFFAHDLSVALNNMPTEKIKSLKVYEEKKDTLNANSEKRLVMDMQTDKIYNDVVFLNAGLTSHPSPFKLDIEAKANAYRRKTYNASLNYVRQTISGRRFLSESVNRNLLNSSLRVDKWYNFTFSPIFNHEKIGNRTLMLEENMLPDFYNLTVSDCRRDRRGWTIGNLMPASMSGKMKNGIGWNMSLGINYKHNDDVDLINRDTYNADPYNEERGGEMLPEDQLASIRINSSEQSKRSVGNALSLGWEGKMTKRVGDNDFGISAKVDFNDRKQKTHDKSTLSYSQLQDSTTVLNRMMSQLVSELNTNMQLFYNHSFGTNHHWGLEYNLGVRDNHQKTQYLDVIDEAEGVHFLTSHSMDGLVQIDSLCYKASDNRWMNTIGANITFDWTHFGLQASAAAIPTFLRVSTHRNIMADDKRSYNALLYSAALSSHYKGKAGKVVLGYEYSEDTPPSSMLINVVDYSDPLRVVMGSTELSKTKRHSVGLQYEKGFGFYVDSRFLFDQNTPTYKVTYDQLTGRSISTPTPINGNWSEVSNLRYSFKVFKRDFNFTASHIFRRNVNYVQLSGSQDVVKGKTDYNTFNAALNHTISNKSMLIRLTAQYMLTDMTNSSYNMHSTQGDFQAKAYAMLNLPLNFDITADATYSIRHGHKISELNKDRFVLNLLLDYRFLKSKATVELEWKDVFHQVRNIDIRNTDYIRTETRTFGNTSMFLATFKYRFNLFE